MTSFRWTLSLFIENPRISSSVTRSYSIYVECISKSFVIKHCKPYFKFIPTAQFKFMHVQQSGWNCWKCAPMSVNAKWTSILSRISCWFFFFILFAPFCSARSLPLSYLCHLENSFSFVPLTIQMNEWHSLKFPHQNCLLQNIYIYVYICFISHMLYGSGWYSLPVAIETFELLAH